MNKNQKIIAAGLKQIPDRGLRRLYNHLRNNKPVLLNGGIVEFELVEHDDGTSDWEHVY